MGSPQRTCSLPRRPVKFGRVLDVEFHPHARADFLDAVDWYNGERAGLGASFANAVQRTVERIAMARSTGSLAGAALRRMLVPKFPYCVIYAAEPSRLWIVAVAHFRRRPTYWRDRL